MAPRLDLTKNQNVEVRLQHVVVGLGWLAPDGCGQEEFDLDASAFMMTDIRKIPEEGFLVYYNNQTSMDGSVQSDGGNTGDSEVSEDSERLSVTLDRVRQDINEILFVVTIYDGRERHQTFAPIRNAYIRITDPETKTELLRYALEDDFGDATAVEFGRLVRQGNLWSFQAIGKGLKKDLGEIIETYFL